MKIHMPEKLFLESNLEKINECVDILNNKMGYIMIDGPARTTPKNKRINSKSTILSNYSFGSGEEYGGGKERPQQRMITRMQNRESLCFNRNRKNSINFKIRHKSALKQKDILLIK